MRKMGSRAKEEERLEMMLRSLLKLPENRRCINCNSLGPQYVCTTFLTFVCTYCSGIHREFTHRVKSISMAKFTAEEVSALQAAGNERARQIYLKGWDPRRNSYPDGSNLRQLRDFIKHVYVDRKYTSERNDELPRLRLGDKEEPYESRMVGAYIGEFRSPSYASRYEPSSRRCYGGRSDDRNFRYYFDERGSARYNWENSRSGARKKNPVCFEIVDDRFRDDVYRSGRRSDGLNFTNRDCKSGSRSPKCQWNTKSSNSSVVCPIKDIYCENAPRQEVGKHSKAIDGNYADGSANSNEKSAPSRGLHSVDRNPMENKKMHSESLINSNIDPEPTDAAVMTQETQPVTPSSDSGDLSTHEASSTEKAPSSPAPNTVEFLLFELAGSLVAQNSNSAPKSVSESSKPAHDALTSVITSGTASTINMQPTGGIKPEAAVSSTKPVDQMLMLPTCVDTSVTASTTNTPVQQSGRNIPPDGTSPAISGQMSTLPSSCTASTSASTTHLLDKPSGGNMPPSSVSPTSSSGQMKALPYGVGDSTTASNAIVPVSSFDGGPAKAAADSRVESASNIPDVQKLSSTQKHFASSAIDGKCSSTQQTSTSVGPLNYQSWASPLLPHNQGSSRASAEQSSQTASKPAQDTSYRVGSEPFSVETKSSGRKELPADLFTGYLPACAQVRHLQSGRDNATGFNMQYYPHAMLVPGYSNPGYSSPAKSTNPFDFNSGTSPMLVPQQGALPNVGPHSLEFTAFQSPLCASAMHPQSPSFPSASSSSSASMGQKIHTNMTPTRLQEIDSFGSDVTVLGSSNTPQQPTGGYPVSMATNSYSSIRGNPFE